MHGILELRKIMCNKRKGTVSSLLVFISFHLITLNVMVSYDSQEISKQLYTVKIFFKIRYNIYVV